MDRVFILAVVFGSALVLLAWCLLAAARDQRQQDMREREANVLAAWRAGRIGPVVRGWPKKETKIWITPPAKGSRFDLQFEKIKQKYFKDFKGPIHPLIKQKIEGYLLSKVYDQTRTNHQPALPLNCRCIIQDPREVENWGTNWRTKNGKNY